MNITEAQNFVLADDKDAIVERLMSLEANLRQAIKYLENPEVQAIPFALPPVAILDRMRELVGD